MTSPGNQGDDALAVFADALRHEVEAKLASHRPQPDALDVVDRALGEDPDAVIDGFREELLSVQTEVDVPRREPDSELGLFADALRSEVESVVEERGLTEIPPVPRRPRRWRALGVAVVAAAAAIIAALALPDGQLVEEAPEPARTEAPRALERHVPEGDFATRPRPVPHKTRTVHPPDEPDQGPPVPAPAPPPRKPQRPSLADVEAAAGTAWRDGDLARAEQLYRRVIDKARGGRQADLAYGDLFALVRQRRGPAGQAATWREYLREFPSGRYAEDARAGLCRRSKGDDRDACWERYLARHPNGAHAGEARRSAPQEDDP